MLIKGDMGSAKNSCFAVSCLASDGVATDSGERVFANSHFAEVASRLMKLITNDEDEEAAWFAAM